MTIMMVVEKMTMAPDWGSVLSRVFIAEFSPRTLIQNFDAEENFLCFVWILISFQWVEKIRIWFDLPLPQVSDLLSIMGQVYNHRGPFWQYPHPGIFKKWVMSTLYTHHKHYHNHHSCSSSPLSAWSEEMLWNVLWFFINCPLCGGTAGSERAECCLSSEPVLKA